MLRLLGIATIAVALCFGIATASTKQLREYVSRDNKIAISFPAGWKLKLSVRNEVWLASGTIRGVSSGCFVRLSSVSNLRFINLEEYFTQNDEKAFVKLSSIATPDIRVHLYDFSYLGDRRARRIIYSGTDEGIKVGNLVHQTLDGDRIVTVTCFTEQQNFQLIYNELKAIPASFRFIK